MNVNFSWQRNIVLNWRYTQVKGKHKNKYNINITKMKKSFLILTILMSLITLNIHAQCGGATTKSKSATTTTSGGIGIIIYSNDVETVFNALRFANYSITAGDTVNIFLLGKGVELDTLVKKSNDIKMQIGLFTNSGGVILGCGTCLKSRNMLSPQVCKMSSMGDLYDIIKKSKIVLTF